MTSFIRPLFDAALVLCWSFLLMTPGFFVLFTGWVVLPGFLWFVGSLACLLAFFCGYGSMRRWRYLIALAGVVTAWLSFGAYLSLGVQ